MNLAKRDAALLNQRCLTCTNYPHTVPASRKTKRIICGTCHYHIDDDRCITICGWKHEHVFDCKPY